jgi:hypothetical protein
MPVTDSEFGKLKDRVQKLETVGIAHTASVAGLPGSPTLQPAQRPSALNMAVTVVGTIVAVAACVGAAAWRVGSEIERVDKKTQALTMAVKVLADAQGGRTKELVDDALAIAQARLESGQMQAAHSALSIANRFIAEERAANGRLSDGTFKLAAHTYSEALAHPMGNAGIMDEAFKGSVQLAEYRSALAVAQHIEGTRFNCPPGSGESPFISALGDQTRAARLVRGVILIGCPEDLDGFVWENVVFIGSKISYHGGAVILRNVSFINCKFEANMTPNGQRFLQYASLDEKSLAVEPEFFDKFLDHS